MFLARRSIRKSFRSADNRDEKESKAISKDGNRNVNLAKPKKAVTVRKVRAGTDGCNLDISLKQVHMAEKAVWVTNCRPVTGRRLNSALQSGSWLQVSLCELKPRVRVLASETPASLKT